MNYKITLAYNGAKYHGWALQPDVITIHGIINKVMLQLFNLQPIINASGRTDAYVHALAQVINLKHDKLNLSASTLLSALNSQLPPDIRVLKCDIVDNDFHACFHCLHKTYNYLIETNPVYNFMQYEQVYQYNKPIDVQKIKALIPLFMGTHNFLSFSTSTLENCVRTINAIEITCHKHILCISINGNGFLRNMVRMIVGVFIAYNENKITVDEINQLFAKPMKGNAKFKAYACGLYLVKPYYQEDYNEPQN